MSNTSFYYQIFEDMPMAIFIVDDDVKVKFLNAEARGLIADGTEVYDKRGGEVLHCIHSDAVDEGCGRAPACNKCIIRNSVNEATKGKKTYRVPTILELCAGDKVVLFHAIISTRPMEYMNNNLFIIVVENANEIMKLRSIIPMCSNCKKVRNDDNYWTEVENYFAELVDVDFTFSLCDECRELIKPKE